MFHLGHKTLLNKALDLSDNILLGITSDEYVRNFKNNGIQDFNTRKKYVEEYLESSGTEAKVEIVSIDNPYEPYLTVSADYDVILVTPHTRETAMEINDVRRQNNLTELEIVISPLVEAEDGGIISSTRIRNGEIDRNGRLYVSPTWINKKLVLPESLRMEFQNPWGEIYKDIPQDLEPEKTIVVGDHTSFEFNKHRVGQFVSIIDFKIRREKRYTDVSELGFNKEEVLKVKNPPGTITWELFEAIKQAILKKGKKTIVIDGEEDLAVLPVLLLSPLGFTVYYGQPNSGMVKVVVGEDVKEKAHNIASQFVLE